MARRIGYATAALILLAGCPRPLPEPIAPDLVPLTVEQALPAYVPVSAVRKRGGCYFYQTTERLVLIETTPAPDAEEVCRE